MIEVGIYLFLGTIGLYIVARIAASAVARSWYEEKNKHKTEGAINNGKTNKQK